jgi:hypothetical protein
MSEVRLVICDARREISGDCHGGFADSVIAALSAEPETIAELEVAIERFVAPDDSGFFRFFRHGIRDEPHDAGLVMIDLTARLLVSESRYSAPGLEGRVAYHNGRCATDVWLRYHLPGDWKILFEAEGWQHVAEQRRRERQANPPLDTRTVLYGRPLLEFLAAKCWKAAAGGKPAAPASAANPCDPEEEEARAVREIHASWLLLPRDDLRGQAPRDVLLARQGFIDWSLQDRADQWSALGACPQGLDPQSHAFRYGGYGTHEIVVYYDLVRDLTWSSWDAAWEAAADSWSAQSLDEFLRREVPRLEQFREGWLQGPFADFHGMAARDIIDHERARLPEAVSGREAIIDEDCPLCQMQADMPGPVFWHLDGCNMDPDFAFSFERTREEWEAEERRREDFTREFEQRQAERKRLGLTGPATDPWQSSFAADMPPDEWDVDDIPF